MPVWAQACRWCRFEYGLYLSPHSAMDDRSVAGECPIDSTRYCYAILAGKYGLMV